MQENLMYGMLTLICCSVSTLCELKELRFLLLELWAAAEVQVPSCLVFVMLRQQLCHCRR